MKKRLWAKVLSIVLVLVMVTAWLPMGIASAAGGGTVPPDPPDVDSGDSGDNSFASGEVLALADSWEHAQAIAEAYGLELKSYAYGIAVLSAPNPELTVAQSGRMRRAGIPKLGLNWIYHTNETVYKVDYKKDTYQLPATAYDPYLEVADRTAVYRRATFDESDDPDEPITGQWHRSEMDIDRAWKLSTGTDVVIAVIDTGIDIDHPAFEGRISKKSYNAFTDEIGLEAVRDDWGHGTHVSGIAAASLDSVDDVGGVAPNAELLVIKANVPNIGLFTSEDLYRAINYAAANGADIINMSLGRYYADGESADALEQAVIANAVDSGVTVVCAAGNDNNNHAGYPAAYPECIAVSATRQGFQFDNWYSTSNYGPEIDVAAPGGEIYSTVIGGGYDFMSGTSMASPNVAGTAALILALNSDYSPQQVRDALSETARDAGALGRDDYYGSGIVNAYAAVCDPDALYNVTYDFNDGIRDSVVVKVIPESTLLEPDIPWRDGYAFEGWFVSETEEEFDFATPVEGDFKLDAKWVEAEDGMYVLEFPDPNFRREVLRMLTEQDGGRRKDSSFVEDDLELLASMELLFLWGMGICDMTGLQYFPGLKELTLSFNQLTELDISGNTALEALYCPGNQLTELDVTQNTALVTLSCSGNQLAALDVTRNTALAYLYCDYNQLTELDVSKNTALEILFCYYNQLTELDVSPNTSLEILDCDGNELTELDVSKNIALTSLWCGWNQLTELDVSNNPALKEFVCHVNQLTALDVDNNMDLEVFDCGSNDLRGLDLSNHMNLNLLYCGGNRLNTLELPNPSALAGLYCENNQLTVLDVSGMTALEELACRNNALSELNVSNNANLNFLECNYNYMASIDKVIGWQSIPGLIPDETFIFYPQRSGNPPTGQDITDAFKDAGFLAAVREIIGKPEGPILDYDVAWIQELNVSNDSEADESVQYSISDLSGIEHFGSLIYLFCSGQQLTELDVSNNTALEHLDCTYNQLNAIDVSQNIALRDLWLDGNVLTSIDVSNNPMLASLWLDNNQLIALDLSKNIVLESLWCIGNELTALDVSKNTALVSLNCSSNQLTTLDVTKNPLLTVLACYDNGLTALDVTKNPALEYLYCFINQLAELDISKNSALIHLDCASNELTKLDVSNNTAMVNLYCYDNWLTALDLSNNVALELLRCWFNKLTELDVSYTALTNLDCSYNHMQSNDNVIGWLALGLIEGDTFIYEPQWESFITIKTQPPALTTVTKGSISGSLSVAASVSNDAALSYQWYSNTRAFNRGGETIEGATSATFVIPQTLPVGTHYYYCVVSADGVRDITSNVATVQVNSPSSTGDDRRPTTSTETVPDTTPPLDEGWANPYIDVTDTDWFYEAVCFITESKLMDGTAADKFAPNVTMSRAMLVTVLYRLEGKPLVSGDIPFLDVKNDEWYSDAILWAGQNNIVNGYTDGTFGLNDPVTREQAVTILYRYAKAKGLDISATADLSKYTDMTDISDWALDAMKWSVAVGIIQGRTDTTIVPKGISTRAEGAMIFKRYMEDFLGRDDDSEK